MSGRVLLKVIQDERDGKAAGHTVQIIPHVTNAIQEHIEQTATGYDVHIVEIGGTVGDYESLSFIEAIREFGMRVGRDNAIYVHVVYLPYLGVSNEIKTKPAQNAVRELRGLGITPDVLVARSEQPVGNGARGKLSMFTGVDERAVVMMPNAETIYDVPLTLQQAEIDDVIIARLGLGDRAAAAADMSAWQETVRRATDQAAPVVNVGVVAKYLDNTDTYMSVFESLRHAAWKHDLQVKIHWLDAEKLNTNNVQDELAAVDGIVVPGGFGVRGVEGKIAAARYALREKQPYLGLCLGMQVAVIAAAREAGLTQAHSTEFDADSPDKVIDTMDDQQGKENTGGTMRLGDYPCVLAEGSVAATLYGAAEVQERHRHRYEASNAYREQYASWGIRAVGTSPDGQLVEIIEATDHPYMIASQFHPEFKSRPGRPHPLFDGFMAAIAKTKR